MTATATGASRSLVAVLVLVGLTAVACGSAAEGASQSDQPESVPASENMLVGQPGGRFLVEVLHDAVVVRAGCEELPPASAESLDDSDSEDALVGLLDAIDAVAATCDDSVAWAAGMLDVTDRIDAFDQAVRRWSDAPPADYESRPSTGAPVDITPYVVRALERLHYTLTDSAPMTASKLWFSSQHLGVTSQLRALGSGEDLPPAVIVGSSIGYRGLDAQRMGDSLATPVYNAGLVGASPPIVSQWLDELWALGAGHERVIWAVNSHELHTCTGAERIARPLKAQRGAFAPVAASSVGDRLDWVLGPVAAPVSASSPIGADWLTRFDGVDPSLDETDRDVLARHRSQLDRYADPAVCAAEVAALEAAIRKADEKGAVVTVVVMPVHSEIIDAHPQGLAGHRDAIEAMVRGLGNRAEVIDLSERVGDDAMVDLVHLDRRGRAVVSDLLATAIAA